MTIKEIRTELTEVSKRKSEINSEIEATETELTKNYDELNAEEVENYKGLIEENEKELNALQTKEKGLQEQLKEAEFKKAEDMAVAGKSFTVKTDENTVAKSAEFLNAYVKAIKTGDDSTFRAMQKTIGTSDANALGDFGSVIPTYVAETIERKMMEYGTILNHSNRNSVKGLIKMAVELTATDAVVHVEGTDAPTEEEITLGELIVEPQNIKKWIRWTDELEMMSGVDLIDYLSNEFVEKIVLAIEKQQMIGAIHADGKGLQGFYTHAQVAGNKYVGLVSVKNIDRAALLEAIGRVRGQNVKMFMNRQTFFSNIMGEIDTTGQPIYRELVVNGTISYVVMGVQIEFNDALVPANSVTAPGAKAPVVLVAAQGAYKTNEPNGFVPTFVLDRTSEAEKDLVKLVGKHFIGGRPTKIDGAVVIEKTVAA